MAQLTPATYCPLIKDECIQFKCMFWTHLLGSNPQKEETIDEWDCAIKWLPVLLIEGSKETRQTAAAIESFRNEMVKDNQKALSIMASQPASLPHNPDRGDGALVVSNDEVARAPLERPTSA